MGFSEDLSRVACDPEIRRLAERRAGSRELAADALQQTYWVVARTRDPAKIRDLRAYFYTALIHEIDHQRGLALPVPVEHIEATSAGQGQPPTWVETEAAICILAETLLTRLERELGRLTAAVPGRSGDHRRYRASIAAAAREILRLLLAGAVASADWNAVLQSEYPQWCDEPGLAPNVIHQRLSRARSDVRDLLQAVVRKDDLAS